MANRRYAGTPADFAIALGATAELVDDAGAPIPDPSAPETNLEGWAVLIPTLATEFQVYDESSTQYTDLVDHTGASVMVITASAAWETAGQILLFTVNDAPEGDVYLVGTGGVPFTDPTFRLSPVSDEIFSRLLALETATIATTDLTDFSATAPTAGQYPGWDDVLGEYVPTSPGEVVSGVESVNGETGVVDLSAADVGAAPTAHVHSGADVTTGTVDIARLPVGTNSWQVAQGTHTHAISGVNGLQTALDAKVNTADVAKVWPVIGPADPTPVGAVDGDIIVRRQA